jgi:hypothetical protein
MGFHFRCRSTSQTSTVSARPTTACQVAKKRSAFFAPHDAPPRYLMPARPAPATALAVLRQRPAADWRPIPGRAATGLTVVVHAHHLRPVWQGAHHRRDAHALTIASTGCSSMLGLACCAGGWPCCRLRWIRPGATPRPRRRGRTMCDGKGRAGAAHGSVAWRISERAEGMERPPAHRTTRDAGPLELPAR